MYDCTLVRTTGISLPACVKCELCSIVAACTDAFLTVIRLLDLNCILVDHIALIAWLPQDSSIAWCSS